MLLNEAMPLAAVVALSIVTLDPEPEALLSVRAPDKPFKLATPPLPPPAPDKQAPKLSTPELLVLRQSPAPPSAVGKVKLRLLAVAPDWRVRVLALVEFFRIIEPVVVEAVPTVREAPVIAAVPVMVRAEPDSLRMESAITLAPVNLAILPVVPPAVVTPPPLPAQLPTVVQIV